MTATRVLSATTTWVTQPPSAVRQAMPRNRTPSGRSEAVCRKARQYRSWWSRNVATGTISCVVPPATGVTENARPLGVASSPFCQPADASENATEKPLDGAPSLITREAKYPPLTPTTNSNDAAIASDGKDNQAN